MAMMPVTTAGGSGTFYVESEDIVYLYGTVNKDGRPQTEFRLRNSDKTYICKDTPEELLKKIKERSKFCPELAELWP